MQTANRFAPQGNDVIYMVSYTGRLSYLSRLFVYFQYLLCMILGQPYRHGGKQTGAALRSIGRLSLWVFIPISCADLWVTSAPLDSGGIVSSAIGCDPFFMSGAIFIPVLFALAFGKFFRSFWIIRPPLSRIRAHGSPILLAKATVHFPNFVGVFFAVARAARVKTNNTCASAYHSLRDMPMRALQAGYVPFLAFAFSYLPWMHTAYFNTNGEVIYDDATIVKGVEMALA